MNEGSPQSGPNPKLLHLLVCSPTKQTLRWNPVRSELVSEGTRLAHPVRGGVPVMLPSEARALEP